MQENQNFVFGGLDTDSDLRVVGSNRYISGSEIEHFIDDQNTIGSVTPAKGTKLAYTIPNITPQNVSFRIPFITTSNTDYKFYLYDENNVEYFVLERTNVGVTTSDVDTLGFALATSIELQPNIQSVLSYTNTLGYQTVAVSQGGFRFDIVDPKSPYRITCFVRPTGTTEYTEVPVIILQDAINYTAELQPLSTALLGDYQYVLSKAKDNLYCEIGAAKMDINGTWEYTRLAGSEQFGFPLDKPILINAELVGNNKVGLYWVDETNKPKVFYVNLDVTMPVFRYYWGQEQANSGVIYNINGSYNLNNIDAQSNLQIFNNEATVTVVNQLSTGGKLVSGGKRYYVRFGVNGIENATPFNEIGEYTIVYKADNESPRNAVKIKGDATPTVTTKQVVLKIENCNADIFNFLELVCVEYQGGAASGTLVGRYDVTSNTMTINHSGFELNSSTFDLGGLPNVTPVILTAKTNEIKKNRYNLANVQLDGDSEVYAEIAKNITISSGRKTINKVGNINIGGKINAFQVGGYSGKLQTGGGTLPLSRGGSFYIYPSFMTDTNAINVYDNAYSAYNSGIYTASVATSGVQTINLSYNIYGLVQQDAGTLIDFARVVIYVYNFDNTISSIIYDKTINRKSDFEVNYAENVSLVTELNAGQYIRADWFVQGNQCNWTIQSSNFQSIVGVQDSSNFGKNLTENEYQKAENVANNMGYMLYEPYPYYIRFHNASGYVTNPFYIGIHTIKPSDFGDDSLGLTKLTDAAGNPYVYHPIFNNIDISNIKSSLVGISFWRGQINNPNVIACGVNLMANKLSAAGYYAGFYASKPISLTYGDAFPLGSENVRFYSAFISPDNIYKNGELIKYQTGDKMYVAGQPTALNASNNIISAIPQKVGSFVEFSGYCANSGGFTAQTLSDAQYTPFRQQTDRYIYNANSWAVAPTKLILNNESQILPSIDTASVSISFDVRVSMNADIPSNQDYGVYVGYYIRENTNTDYVNIDVVDCNSYFKITNTSANILQNIDVFGGDTYTQKNYTRLLYNSLAEGAATTSSKHESFISYYTQNRYNTQMRKSSDEGCVLFPADAKSIVQYLDDNNEEFYLIDDGYNEQNNRITAQRPYNKNVSLINKFPSRIYYTAQRPTGSSYDSYRDIKPLDFKDLDGKNGQITSLYDINDTMIAVQKHAVTVLPYQTDVLLKSDNGAEIYIGNGGVYAQRESIVSTYGTDLTTQAFRGFNKNGNASLYWYSEVVKKVFKYGRDGIKCISDDAKMRNFFLNRTKFINNEFDIVMGFDTKREVLWISGLSYSENQSLWNNDTTYTSGQIVSSGVSDLYNYPLFYIANRTNIGKIPSVSTDDWELMPITNTLYYSVFTILYNERLNTFTTERKPIPRRYFQYNNVLLVPKPNASYGKVYELNNGTDNVYFDTEIGEFYIEPVINKIQNISKRFISIGLNSGEEQPTYPTVNFTTSTQQSTSNTFEQKNGNIWVAVEPDNVGEPMVGEYLKFKILTATNITLLDATSKFYYRPRLPK